jgi:hypothetical protein
MKRNYGWIAVCVTMWSGVGVLAQQPMPNPYGNPGFNYPIYPVPPSGPSMPYATPPSMPYAPQPPMPPGMPAWQRPPMPGYTNTAPSNIPAEPYFVQPEGPPPASPPMKAPESRPVAQPFNRFIQVIAPSGPTEPFTMYEGPRQTAEMKNDDTRVWAQANYIHWWVRKGYTPPLVTTGDPANPNPGILGSADTSTLLGNGPVAPQEFSGIQATLGMWLDEERLESLEISGFWLGKNSRQYSFASDANGSTPLAQPVIIGGNERALVFAQPGVFAGSINVSTVMDFHSLELNLARNILRFNGWSIDSLVGFRYLYLNESLGINQNVTVLANGANFIPFPGQAQTPAGSNFRYSDSFDMTNRFYGGTIGIRSNFTCGPFDIGSVLKLSMGGTMHVANINGTTTLNAVDGTTTTVRGSSLAQASNIGTYNSTDFSVVPELTVTAGYQVTSNLRVLIGYTAIDWNRVQRVGNQIDRTIDFQQVPTSPNFVPGSVGNRPAFPAVRTDFWAQGINVGMELKF